MSDHFKTWTEVKDTCPITRAKFMVRAADALKNKTVRIDVVDLRYLLSLVSGASS